MSQQSLCALAHGIPVRDTSLFKLQSVYAHLVGKTGALEVNRRIRSPSTCSRHSRGWSPRVHRGACAPVPLLSSRVYRTPALELCKHDIGEDLAKRPRLYYPWVILRIPQRATAPTCSQPAKPVAACLVCQVRSPISRPPLKFVQS